MTKSYLYFFSAFITVVSFFVWADQNDFENLYQLYKQADRLNQNQIYSLEIKIANLLLQKAQKQNLQNPLNEGQKKEIEKNIQQALFFYNQSMNKVKNKEEEAKILFRVGYLHEMRSSFDKAIGTYTNVLKISQDSSRIEKARHLIQEIQNRSRNIHLLQIQNLMAQAEKNIKLSRWKKAFQQFKQICSLYKNIQNCRSQQCSSIFPNIKELVQKVQGSKNNSKWTLRFYKAYLSSFPYDLGLMLTAGRLAENIQQYEDALYFYQMYILNKKYKIQFSIKEQKNKDLAYKHLENVFQSHHFIILFLKNPSLRVKAYDFYLDHSPLKTFVFETRYLKHIALFDLGKFEITAPVFRQIALSGSKNFSQESAFMALKSLMKMNQGIIAQKWAMEFSKIFPKQAPAFKKIVQSALLSEMISSINSIETQGVPVKPSKNFDFVNAWNILNYIPSQEVLVENKSEYCFYSILLAVELHHFYDFEKISSQCLESNISSDDRWIAHKRMEVFEATYNFEKAYAEAVKIYGNNKNKNLHHLCLLSILSYQEEKNYCHQFVYQNSQDENSIFFMENMIRQSKNAKQLLDQNIDFISKNKEVLSSLYFQTESWKQPDSRLVQALSQYEDSKAYLFKRRKTLVDHLDKMKKHVHSHLESMEKMNNLSHLPMHINFLVDMEKWVESQPEDWAFRTIAFGVLHKEYSTFYDFLSSKKSFFKKISFLHLSELFNKQKSKNMNKQNIQKIINDTQLKLAVFKKKIHQLWKMRDDQIALSYLKDAQAGALSWEVKKLVEVAPGEYKQKISKYFHSLNSNTPKTVTVKNQWALLNDNPFRSHLLKNTIEKHHQISGGVIPIYLNDRLKLQTQSPRLYFPVKIERASRRN